MARRKLEGKTKLDLLKKKPNTPTEKPKELETISKTNLSPKSKTFRFSPSDLDILNDIKRRLARKTKGRITETRIIRAGLLSLYKMDDEELISICGQVW
jgi:hypothetical protein